MLWFVIWMANVRSSNLLNKASLFRALQDISQGLFERGMLTKHADYVHMLETTRLQETVTFPAFDLFTPGKQFPVYQWFLPKPFATIKSFLATYDQFVSQELGVVANPGRVASTIYGEYTDAGRQFTHFKYADQWYAPGLILAAASQWLGAELDYSGSNGVCLRLGNGLIEVTSEGCWSNTQRRIVPAKAPSVDESWPVTPFPATGTRNRQLVAFKHISESLPAALQYAANLLALGLKEEVINDAWLYENRTEIADRLLKRSRAGSQKLDRATLAVQQCSEVLEDGLDVVPRLYEVAVPGLMGAHRFKKLFGPVVLFQEGRVTREETLQRWRDLIQQTWEDLQNANC